MKVNLRGYYARRKRGQCVRCQNPARSGKATCEACGKYVAADHMRRYNRRKKEGRCVVCGEARAQEGQTQCRDCADASAIRAGAYYRIHRARKA